VAPPPDDDGPDPEAAPPVGATYDRIAEQFARTRQTPWPEVEAFLEAVPRGDLGLDLGCANGRHLGPLADRVDRVAGVDLSRALLDVAAAEGHPAALVRGDAAAVPLGDGRVDVALYVATVHHLRPRAARVASLDELARVLAPGGRAFVSAWAVDHDRFDADEAFDTTVDWTLPDGETVPRFYHVYDLPSFRADLAESDLRVDDAYLASGNCYAEVRGSLPASAGRTRVDGPPADTEQ